FLGQDAIRPAALSSNGRARLACGHCRHGLLSRTGCRMVREAETVTGTETDFTPQFDIDEPVALADSAEAADQDVIAAKQAWQADPSPQAPDLQVEASGLADNPADAQELASDSDGQSQQLAEPFVSRWNELVSRTNWEKGSI